MAEALFGHWPSLCGVFYKNRNMVSINQIFAYLSCLNQ